MNQIRALLGETAIGYAYWTLIHGLGPMIWFYPLNELDITGYEAYVLVALSPVLLLFGRCFRSLFSSRYGQGFLRLLMIGEHQIFIFLFNIAYKHYSIYFLLLLTLHFNEAFDFLFRLI